jgi:hypothetical protein
MSNRLSIAQEQALRLLSYGTPYRIKTRTAGVLLREGLVEATGNLRRNPVCRITPAGREYARRWTG